MLHKKESLKLDVILKVKKVKFILIANKGLVGASKIRGSNMGLEFRLLS